MPFLAVHHHAAARRAAGDDQAVALVATGIDVALAVWLVVRRPRARRHPLVPPARSPLWHVERFTWFEALGIQYFVGVDGVSVLMILLTAVVIFCGVLASWNDETAARSSSSSCCCW